MKRRNGRHTGWLLALILLAAGRALASTNGAVTTTVRILTSFYPMYLATLNVVGELPGVEVTNLAGPQTGCLHDFQLSPADLMRLTRADLFVVNGAGMEAFLDKVVAQLPALRLIQASEGIELLPEAGSTASNAHVWVSVPLFARQARNIAAQLARADPARAEGYRRNGEAYAGRLERLAAEMRAALTAARGRPIVTFHEAFPYFARDFGLEIVAVIAREPGSEPSAGELAATVAQVRACGARALFTEPQYPVRAAAAIARETGARVYALDPVVTGPPRADAYETIMRRNLAVLREALKE